MSKQQVPDELWNRIEPLLPEEPPKPKGGRPRIPDRDCVTGIIFVLKSGIPWEMVPQEMGCGSGMTSWRRLRDWQEAGVWDRLFQTVLNDLGEADQIMWERACVRVLDRLFVHRILTRLERRIGGVRHGSTAYIWCLDVVGDRLVRAKGTPRRRVQEPSFPFLDHTLAVTETHVRLREAASEGYFHLSKAQIETEAWRDLVNTSGARTVLKPDLMITVSGGDYDDHWYLEIDRGTESLPVLLRKSRAYEEYRRTGRAQTEHGVFPRVLWVLPNGSRVERLRGAIDVEPILPDRLFTCITGDGLIDTLRDPP